MQEAALSSGQGGGEGGEALGRDWQSGVRGRVGRELAVWMRAPLSADNQWLSLVVSKQLKKKSACPQRGQRAGDQKG